MFRPTRSRRGVGAVLCLGVALALAACNGNGDAPDDAPDAANGGAAVTIEGFEYDPNPLTVSAGTTVTFTNEDSVGHTVTSGAPGEPDGSFDEQLSGGGDTATVTFDEAGTFAYFCTFHPQMIAEVVVQ